MTFRALAILGSAHVLIDTRKDLPNGTIQGWSSCGAAGRLGLLHRSIDCSFGVVHCTLLNSVLCPPGGG
jgi:hypothetical protein